MFLTIFLILLNYSYAQHCLYSDTDQVSLRNTYHQFRNNKKCLPCRPECKSCFSSTDATCASGNCQQSYYYNITCHKCAVFCVKCTGAAKQDCSICLNGYFLHPILKQCEKCNQGVKTCSQAVSISCNDDYYYDQKSYLCRKCGSYCSSCSYNKKCGECKHSYFLQNGLCENCINNCQICLSKYSCSKCMTGYQYINQTCLTFKNCEQNCLQCNSEIQCIRCNSEYYLYNKSCYYGSSLMCKHSFGTYYGQCQQCQTYAYHPNQAPTYCIPIVSSSQKQTRIFDVFNNEIVCQTPFMMISQSSSAAENSKHIIIKNYSLPSAYKISLKIVLIIKDKQLPKINLNVETKLLQNVTSPIHKLFCLSKQSQHNILSTKHTYKITNRPINSQNVEITLSSNSKIYIKQIMIEASLCFDTNCQLCTSGNVCIRCYSPWLLQQYSCYKQCSYGFYLNQNLKTCVYECQQGYYNNETTTTCTKCLQNCQNCRSQQSCTSCVDNYYLDGYNCSMQCNNASYFTNQNNKQCTKCTYPCKQCSKNGQNCTSCAKGYLIGNFCISICPKGYYGSLINSSAICSACAKQCVQCHISANLCMNCPSNKYLFGGKCHNQCPSTYYPSNQIKQCVKCLSPCSQCNISALNCTTCSIGYLLIVNFTNKCVNICPQQLYYPDYNFRFCLKCPSGCRTCYNQSLCQSCLDGFYFLHNQCSLNCSSNNLYYANNMTNKCEYCYFPCQQCQSDFQGRKCLSCKKNYSLHLINSQCYLLCPMGFYSNNQICTMCVQRCTSCQKRQLCLSCSQQYWLFNGTCLIGINCPMGTYSLSNKSKQCATCDRSCFTCILVDTYCLSCIQGLYLVQQDHRCTQLCPTGTYGNNTICSECLTECKQCKFHQQCLSCVQGWFLLNSTCTSLCPDGYYGQFITRTCSKCLSSCTKCISLSQCKQCSIGYHFFNNKCQSSCPDGYFPNNSRCINCQIQCAICSSLNSCSVCKYGYFFRNNSCTRECPSGFYPNIGQQQCSSCLLPCITCINELKCTSCQNKLVLLHSKCWQHCPTFYYLFNNSQCQLCGITCQSCLNNQSCTSCITGFYLYLNQCYESCPQQYYANILSNQCSPCQQPCRICTKQYQCLTCVKGYFLRGSRCISICPLDSYNELNDLNETVCSLCPKICASCSSLNNCLSCVAPFYLYNQNCVDKCPLSTYNSSGSCLSCLKECQTCEFDNCSSCSQYYLLENYKCVASCSRSYYQNSYSCQKCSLWCSKCTNATFCLECQHSYIHEGSCIDTCPIGTYHNLYHLTCQKCLKGCKKCQGQSNCQQCMLPYILYHTTCIQGVCPIQLYYNIDDNQCVLECINYIYHQKRYCYNEQCPTHLVLRNDTNSCVDQCQNDEYINQKVICQKGSSENQGLFTVTPVLYNTFIMININFKFKVLYGLSREQLVNQFTFHITKFQQSQRTSLKRRGLQSQLDQIQSITQLKGYSQSSLQYTLKNIALNSRNSYQLKVQSRMKNPYQRFQYQNIPLQIYKQETIIPLWIPYQSLGLNFMSILLSVATILITIVVIVLKCKLYLLQAMWQCQQFLYLLCFINMQLPPTLQPFMSSYFVIGCHWTRTNIIQIKSPPAYYHYAGDIHLLNNTYVLLIILATLTLLVSCLWVIYNCQFRYKQYFILTKLYLTRSVLTLGWLFFSIICLFCMITIFYNPQPLHNPIDLSLVIAYILLPLLIFGSCIYYCFKLYHNRLYFDSGMNPLKKSIALYVSLYRHIRKIFFVFFLSYYHTEPIYVLCIMIMGTFMIFIIVWWFQLHINYFRQLSVCFYEVTLFALMLAMLILVMNPQKAYQFGILVQIIAILLITSTFCYPSYYIYCYIMNLQCIKEYNNKDQEQNKQQIIVNQNKQLEQTNKQQQQQNKQEYKINIQKQKNILYINENIQADQSQQNQFQYPFYNINKQINQSNTFQFKHYNYNE